MERKKVKLSQNSFNMLKKLVIENVKLHEFSPLGGLRGVNPLGPTPDGPPAAGNDQRFVGRNDPPRPSAFREWMNVGDANLSQFEIGLFNTFESADGENRTKLIQAFPNLFDELDLKYLQKGQDY